MECPKCNSANTRRNGKNDGGTQRFRCDACGKSWTEGHPKAGAKPIGIRALTPTEQTRVKRLRLKIQKIVNVALPEDVLAEVAKIQKAIDAIRNPESSDVSTH